MNAAVNLGLAGYFKIEAHQVDENGNKHSHRVVADWFPNLITDNGLEMVKYDNGRFFLACQLGTGTAPPQVTDTALQARVAGMQNPTTWFDVGPGSAVSPYYSSCVISYAFAQGAVVGNISEIGTSATATGTLFSRALILDALGNPTTITILAIEQLTVTYQWRVYRAEGDILADFLIGGVTYNTISRPARIGSTTPAWVFHYFGIKGDANQMSAYSGPIGPATGGPSGTFGNNTTNTVVRTYAPFGQYWMDENYTWGINDGNVAGGIQSVEENSQNRGLCTQVQFTPKIPKDNTKTFSVTIRTSWARYTPP